MKTKATNGSVPTSVARLLHANKPPQKATPWRDEKGEPAIKITDDADYRAAWERLQLLKQQVTATETEACEIRQAIREQGNSLDREAQALTIGSTGPAPKSRSANVTAKSLDEVNHRLSVLRRAEEKQAQIVGRLQQAAAKRLTEKHGLREAYETILKRCRKSAEAYAADCRDELEMRRMLSEGGIGTSYVPVSNPPHDPGLASDPNSRLSAWLRHAAASGYDLNA